MPVHVTLHDVSPAFDAEIEWLLAACHARAIRPGLLVVPNYHARAELPQSPRYVARIRALQAAGHEVFLHGFYHRAEARPMSARRVFRQRIVSAGEAEFADLGAEEGRRRLQAGCAMFAQVGLQVDGFVPPAWSMQPWLLPALRGLNVSYTETHLRIFDPVRGRSQISMVYNFASRSVARIATTALFCRASRPLARLLPARLALHPGDVRSPILRTEVLAALDWAAGQIAPNAAALFA